MDAERDPITEALKIARRCGVGIEEFWASTPWMLGVAVSAEGQRAEHEYRLALYGAWHTAMLGHSDPKKVPSLDKLLSRKQKAQKTPDNVDEPALLAAFQAYNRRIKQASSGASPSETK